MGSHESARECPHHRECSLYASHRLRMYAAPGREADTLAALRLARTFPRGGTNPGPLQSDLLSPSDEVHQPSRQIFLPIDFATELGS